MIRPKTDLRISCTLQHVFVHLPVSRTITALSTGRVEHDFAFNLPGGRLILKSALLQLEVALYGVQRIAQIPVGVGLSSIALQEHFLPERCTCERHTHGQADRPCSISHDFRLKRRAVTMRTADSSQAPILRLSSPEP